MQILWNKEIDEIKNSGYLENNLSITDALIEKFYNEILTESDKKLLQLSFLENPSQEDLDNLLKNWDIEAKPASKTIMLSYFMKLHPDLKFTSYEEPRLKGLLNYEKFKNMKIIAHFKKIGRELNKNNIKPLVIKGGAMKFLRQELPRVMGDIDIVVPDKDFMKSANLAQYIGYDYTKIDIHSIDLHPQGTEEGAVDLHRFIYMDTGYETRLLKGLFKRAKFEMIFGVESLLPCFEDLMFISLVNLARNLRDKTSQAGLLYTLFDCKYLLDNKPDFDWEIVKDNAKKTKTEVQMNFAIKFIGKISSNILPDSVQNNILFEKEMNDYSNVVMYNRFYLEELRTKCRAIKFGDTILDSQALADYLKYKPKYALLKLLRGHPKLISLLIKDLRGKNDNKKS